MLIYVVHSIIYSPWPDRCLCRHLSPSRRILSSSYTVQVIRYYHSLQAPFFYRGIQSPLWLHASRPFTPAGAPGGPSGPVFPGLPLAPSRPSRPSQPGAPGNPCWPSIPVIPPQLKGEGWWLGNTISAVFNCFQECCTKISIHYNSTYNLWYWI